MPPMHLDEAWEAVVQAANEEGEVVLYSGISPQQIEEVGAAFEDSYPDIDLQIEQTAGSDLRTRIDSEYESGLTGPDVVVLSASEWWWQEKAGIDGFFAEVDSPNLSNIEEWRLQNDPPSVVLIRATLTGFAWNTDAVEGPIQIQDLADPQYKGRVGMLNFDNPTSAAALMLLEEEYGTEFIDGLVANEPRFYPSTVPLAQALAAGEVDVALQMPVTSVVPGSPVEVAFPEHPLASYQYGAVTGWGANPNAAQVFFEYILNGEGAEIMTRELPFAEFDPRNLLVLRDDESQRPAIDEARQRYLDLFGL